MKLFVNNEAFKFQREPPSVTRVKNYLSSLKKGELIKTNRLSAAVGITVTHIRENHFYLTDYSEKHSGKRYYGNKATITQLRKELKSNVKH